jgi:hypothetical protein
MSNFNGFPGFNAPNYTQVPDIVFDELLSVLSGAELKVLLYIIRRTFGFKKLKDGISLSQMMNGIKKRDGEYLDHGTGLSKKTLLKALNSLEDGGYIVSERRRSAERGDEPTCYRLRLKGEEQTTFPVGESEHHGGGDAAEDRGGESIPGPGRENTPHKKQYYNKQLTIDSTTSNSISKGEPPSQFDKTITELSQQFHDEKHIAANITRARNMMESADIDEETFLVLLDEAKKRTSNKAGIKKESSTTGLKNKMPYFFKVLEGLLNDDDTEEVQQPKPKAPAISNDPNKFIKGKYGSLVQY